MKKIRNLLLLCLFAIISTGCIKFNATMDIKKDKSMDFTIIYAVDKSLMGDNYSLKEEQFDNVKKDGYTIEKYSDGNYEGFKIIKKIKNIDEVSTDKDVEFDLSGMMQENENNKYMFKIVKDGDKSTYYAKIKFDSNANSGLNELDDDDDSDEFLDPSSGDDELDLDFDEDDENDEKELADESSSLTTGADDSFDLSALTNSMDLSFTVNLPNKPISSNATSEENSGKKLTWKLGNGTQTIEFAFEIDANASDSNIIMYIGIGVGALLILIILILLLTRKKGNKQVVAIDNNQVKIKNDTKDAVTKGAKLKEKVQVLDEKEQKDNA